MSIPRRILVVGSGAREHAICWALAREPGVERVLVAPGNPLMADAAELHPEAGAGDLPALVSLARRASVDLVVVGPEAPLVAGLADMLARAGVACFGPSAAAARLEGSKSYAREVCTAAGVHMAAGRSFTAVEAALDFARALGDGVVIKADGLAAGKGVAVCATADEAEEHIRAALEHGRFGASGRRVVVEQRLRGREASVIALCDGADAVLLPAARDHKRLGDGDSGPNTGGMGAFSPVTELSAGDLAALRERLFRPVLAEMARRDTPFRGALYAGLMLTEGGPRLLEFNVRLGDPEAQAVLPRLAAPLAPLLAACARGSLAHLAVVDATGRLPTSADATVALALAAEGYPAAPRAGDAIDGLDDARALGALIFGAGVARRTDGALVTAGGRVLTVVGRGVNVAAAAEAAYSAAARVAFAGLVMRRDIGRAALALAG